MDSRAILLVDTRFYTETQTVFLGITIRTLWESGTIVRISGTRKARVRKHGGLSWEMTGAGSQESWETRGWGRNQLHTMLVLFVAGVGPRLG